MRVRAFVPLLVTATVLLAPILHAYVYIHPAWNTKPKGGWILTVLPATYEIVVEGAHGQPSLHREESQIVETKLALSVAQALRAKGWTVSDDVYGRQEAAQNDELLYLVKYLRERHATLADRIMASPQEMKAGRVSFGKPISELRPFTKANVLVFVHVSGFRYTAAAKVLRIAGDVARYGTPGLLFDTDVFSGPKVNIRASFVDTETGDVLCFIKPKGNGGQAFLKELDKLTH